MKTITHELMVGNTREWGGNFHSFSNTWFIFRRQGIFNVENANIRFQWQKTHSTQLSTISVLKDEGSIFNIFLQDLSSFVTSTSPIYLADRPV